VRPGAQGIYRASPNFMGLASFGLEIGIFCGLTISCFPIRCDFGAIFLRASPIPASGKAAKAKLGDALLAKLAGVSSKGPVYDMAQARLGPLGALQSKFVVYGGFVRARRAPNSPENGGSWPEQCPEVRRKITAFLQTRQLNQTGLLGHGRHCHSTQSLAGIGCHSLGVYLLTLLSLLSFSVEMIVSPMARLAVPPPAVSRRTASTVRRLAQPLPSARVQASARRVG
jgi:hypothetical protein